MAGRRAAVVVGINKYDDARIRPELKGAENDAREVFARLQRFGNFEVDKRKHLLLGERAKSENIRRAISDLFWKKDPCDIAVFYFSGHGFLDDYGNGYIAPWDHEYDDPFVCGIRMQELRQYFQANNNKAEALLILDCCHSGVTAEPQKGSADLSGRFYDSLTNDQQTVMGSGKFILASSGADEKSREMNACHGLKILDKKLDELEFEDLEKHNHGVMTYYLLEGMNGGAAEDGAVKIGRLYDYVKGRVNAYQQDGKKDFKTYDCVCSTYEEGIASQTVLVRAPSKSRVDELVRLAEEQLNDVNPVPQPDSGYAISDRLPSEVVFPASLFDAIQHVDAAAELSPESPLVRNLIERIDKSLTDYEGYLDRWLLAKKRAYLDKKYRNEFFLLEKAMGKEKWCFYGLRKLDTEQGNLVIALIRVSLGEEDGPVGFTAHLTRAPFSRALNKTGLAGAPTAARGPTQ
jgi:hypothetical protein